MEVEVCAEPSDHLADWNRLYDELIVRHGLVGIHAFSSEAFRRQFEVPGLVALRAESEGLTVGMTLWFEDPPNAHYHLGAYSKKGYEVSASYALVGAALEHLGERGVRWVDLGGPAGSGPAEDGLVRFKRGWANEERDRLPLWPDPERARLRPAGGEEVGSGPGLVSRLSGEHG